MRSSSRETKEKEVAQVLQGNRQYLPTKAGSHLFAMELWIKYVKKPVAWNVRDKNINSMKRKVKDGKSTAVSSPYSIYT